MSGPTVFEAWVAWSNWCLGVGVSGQRVGRWVLPRFWLALGPLNFVLNLGGFADK